MQVAKSEAWSSAAATNVFNPNFLSISGWPFIGCCKGEA
jgi:hypothetical protein